MNERYMLFVTTKAASYKLHNLEEMNKPIGSASGAFARYMGKLVFLTVSHATLKKGKWCIQTSMDDVTKRPNYYCPNFRFLCKYQLQPNIAEYDGRQLIGKFFKFVGDVDFSYAFIPDDLKVFETLIDQRNRKEISFEKVIYDLENVAIPNKEDYYSFYGETKMKVNEVSLNYYQTPNMVMDLKYLKTYKDFFIFKLSHIISTEDDVIKYQGCSGAPILNSSGNIVSLVTHCLLGTPWIFGINLEKYKVAINIDILSSNIE